MDDFKELVERDPYFAIFIAYMLGLLAPDYEKEAINDVVESYVRTSDCGISDEV